MKLLVSHQQANRESFYKMAAIDIKSYLDYLNKSVDEYNNT